MSEKEKFDGVHGYVGEQIQVKPLDMETVARAYATCVKTTSYSYATQTYTVGEAPSIPSLPLVCIPSPVPGTLLFPRCGWVFVYHVPVSPARRVTGNGTVLMRPVSRSYTSQVGFVVSVERELDPIAPSDWCKAFVITADYAGVGTLSRLVW